MVEGSPKYLGYEPKESSHCSEPAGTQPGGNARDENKAQPSIYGVLLEAEGKFRVLFRTHNFRVP